MAVNELTFPDRHRSNGALDSILAFLAIFTVEVNAKLVILALARAPNAHGNRARMFRDLWIE